VLSTAHSFDETSQFALSVAVVDMRSLAGTRNHCEGSVLIRIHDVIPGFFISPTF
jgi:hypothetical protein